MLVMAEREDPEVEIELWNDHVDDLLRIRLPADDWDGHNTKAPSKALVDSTLILAQMSQRNGVEPDCRIYATQAGTIKFQWQLEDTELGPVFCEIEVTGPFEGTYTKTLENGYSDSWDFFWTKEDLHATREGEK